MALSIFRELLHTAEKLGALELSFTVRLGKYREDDNQNRWSCRALLDPPLPNIAQGRTGEEALRECVRFLERMFG